MESFVLVALASAGTPSLPMIEKPVTGTPVQAQMILATPGWLKSLLNTPPRNFDYSFLRRQAS
jgi:hypothetical protein